ncbi:40S ribosomal protein S10-like protein [Corchorus olitorius]|uniref:40S ribosomal protein S10-like protein n=1 Tax=Corchorus olitorius TaxID=93759 RepID=A0A1R3J7U4_9ROSI|nr:40S ribosomal protein S10-like protein [Corchorus olitorius]
MKAVTHVCQFISCKLITQSRPHLHRVLEAAAAGDPLSSYRATGVRDLGLAGEKRAKKQKKEDDTKK